MPGNNETHTHTHTTLCILTLKEILVAESVLVSLKPDRNVDNEFLPIAATASRAMSLIMEALGRL